MCTLGYLVWFSAAIPGAAKCSGSVERLGVHDDILLFLPNNHQCLERGDAYLFTVQNLILNRLTPHHLHIDHRELENVRICKFHKVCKYSDVINTKWGHKKKLNSDLLQAWLTTNHPSFKQAKCIIADHEGTCSRSSDKKQRVTFALSAHIFKTFSVHVPVGSGMSVTGIAFLYLPLTAQEFAADTENSLRRKLTMKENSPAVERVPVSWTQVSLTQRKMIHRTLLGNSRGKWIIAQCLKIGMLPTRSIL